MQYVFQQPSPKNEKVNFIFPADLNQKAISIAKDLGFSYSEFVRRALSDFIDKIEREKIDNDIARGCKEFYQTDRAVADDWKVTEREGI